MKRVGDTENTQATTPGVNFDQLISNVLTEDGVLPAAAIPLAIAQCRLESDNYTSDVFQANNNLNGYKYDNSAWQDGPGLLSPEGDYYGNYDSVENSAHELSAWWGRRAAEGFDLTTLTSIKNYATALSQFGWFTSGLDAYIARMTAVSALISFQQTTGINTGGVSLTTMGIGIVVVAIGAWYLLK